MPLSPFDTGRIPSGKGGYLIVYQMAADGTADSATARIAHNSKWQGNWTVRLAEVTNSAPGGSRYAPVCEDHSWSLEVPRTDTAYPELLGLRAGNILAEVVFKHGADTKCDILRYTTIESDPVTDDQGTDVVRIMISGKGGDLLRNQAVPVVP